MAESVNSQGLAVRCHLSGEVGAQTHQQKCGLVRQIRYQDLAILLENLFGLYQGVNDLLFDPKWC